MLLLDEPLGALDLKLRRQMQIELKRIQTEVGITFVHVTHDQEEAMTMADTVAVMNGGRVEQLGAPMSLYETPEHGVRRELPRPVQPRAGPAAGRTAAERVVVDCDGQRLAVPADRMPADAGDRLLVGVRPEKIELRTPGGDRAAGENGSPAASSSTPASPASRTQYLVRLPSGQDAVVVRPEPRPRRASSRPAPTWTSSGTSSTRSRSARDGADGTASTAGPRGRRIRAARRRGG